MRTVLVTAPAEEPLGLTETKLHLRVDETADDTLISALITAARRYAEKWTHQVLIASTYDLFLDGHEIEAQSAGMYSSPGRRIAIDTGPVRSITEIVSFSETVSGGEVSTTFNAANYRISGNQVVLIDDASWPDVDRAVDALRIRYVAGFAADAATLSQDFKQALLMTVAHWYENREAAGDPLLETKTGNLMPMGALALLQPYRKVSI